MSVNFTPRPDCNNCNGTGIFAEQDYVPGAAEEPCIFCMEDAIQRGEIDGCIDGVDWVAGKPVV